MTASAPLSLHLRPPRRRRHGARVAAWIAFGGHVAAVVLVALAIIQVVGRLV